MTDSEIPLAHRKGLSQRIVYFLAITLVLIGLLNAMPGIPGIDDLARDIAGDPRFVIRKFRFEYYYPFFFALMMLTVALHHSMWRSWADKSRLRRAFGLFMDLALVTMAIAISLTYIVEIESVCVVDQITGDRARLIAESLKIEKENAAIFGLPEPETVEDPQCLYTTEGWIVAIVGLAVVVFPFLQRQGLGISPRPGRDTDRGLHHRHRPDLVFRRPRGHGQVPRHQARRRSALALGRATARPRHPDQQRVGPARTLPRHHPQRDLPIPDPGLAVRRLGGRQVADQACLPLDAAPPGRTRPCRHRVVRHVRDDLGRTHRQRAVDGRPDDSDDDQARFFPDLRRRDGGRRLVGRLDHAARDGGCGLRAGGADRGSLQRRDRRGRDSGDRLFPLPVPVGGLPVAEAEDRGLRPVDRGGCASRARTSTT